MKIPHNDSSIQTPLGALSKPDNAKNSQAQLSSTQQSLTVDQYHQTPINAPVNDTYNKTLTISASQQQLTQPLQTLIDESMHRLALATGNLYLPGGSVPKAVERMFNQFSAIMTQIGKEQPDLLHRGWGIAIDSDGNLAVTGKISEQQKSYLSERLNSNEEFVEGARQFQENYLKHSQVEYKGWGTYNVNDSNFADVFDLRELVEQSAGDAGFKKTWGKTFSWLELTDNITSQLRRKAEKYDA
ncbi:hypothetical protein [Idiomarina xiamenensis]|uniref:Uncharacterized protein n=1 Tax=Idiomarina xiamenensis 10-D-4 TaxID=740709 RepID=K2KM84_9GAMM|nr:hypothetical protein [Idiomarina xiamenensis]EKE87647.1 hypothetical protein A10D4_01095 [Idiomarina xiamenensis 10-D-4]